jgi:hypothetical protein
MAQPLFTLKLFRVPAPAVGSLIIGLGGSIATDVRRRSGLLIIDNVPRGYAEDGIKTVVLTGTLNSIFASIPIIAERYQGVYGLLSNASLEGVGASCVLVLLAFLVPVLFFSFLPGIGTTSIPRFSERQNCPLIFGSQAHLCWLRAVPRDIVSQLITWHDAPDVQRRGRGENIRFILRQSGLSRLQQHDTVDGLTCDLEMVGKPQQMLLCLALLHQQMPARNTWQFAELVCTAASIGFFFVCIVT